MKLKLLGNATQDWIGDTKFIEKRPGGVHTIRKHLKVKHGFYPTEDSDVTITIGPDGKKYSQWSTEFRDVGNKFSHSEWTHISYLDMLDLDMDKVKESSDIISADLCLEGHTEEQIETIAPMLEYLDWLIGSTEELKDLAPLAPASCIIIEKTKKYIYMRDGDVLMRFDNRFIEVKNPIGAGDVWVAEFLNIMSVEEDPVINTVFEACNEASIRYLQKNGGVSLWTPSTT